MTRLNSTMNTPPEFEEEEEVESDHEPHLNPNLTDDWQEDLMDELGEYSNNNLDPEEVLYGGDSTDFDYSCYDNEEEWDISQGEDEDYG